jgi:chitinase
MKCTPLKLSLALATTLISTSLSATPQFSPYVDFTLSTHWDQQTQSLEPMDVASIAASQGIKSYHLAFITDSGNCQPAWGGQPDYSIDKQWGTSQTKQLAAQGTAIVISFGGANNNDISRACTKDQLISNITQIIQTYHATGLDFDIENGTADVAKLLSALTVVQKDNPKIRLSFTLPVMPEGLTEEGKGIVVAAQHAGLTFHVNIMAMDYGPSYSGDMSAYAILAATHLQELLQELYSSESPQQLWQRIEVTPMIGVNDVSVEQFTLKNADELKEFAQKNQLGGLSFWSFNRDKPCADKWTSNWCSGNNLQTTDYEFAQHFK